MGKGFSGVIMRAFGAQEHLAVVTGVRWQAPHVIRIDFRSETLLYPDGEQPAAWVRCWFPDPEGGNKLFQRGYTLLDPDPASGTFGICFLVHDPAGPASLWAMAAQPGEELIVQRLGGDGWELTDPHPTGYLLVGDAASWPGIHTIIEAAPHHVPVRVFLEAAHDHDGSCRCRSTPSSASPGSVPRRTHARSSMPSAPTTTAGGRPGSPPRPTRPDWCAPT